MTLLTTTDSMACRKHIHYSIAKGANFATEVKKLETDITTEMLAR
jgi:phenylalanyl-tRNA synthetase alpha chain